MNSSATLAVLRIRVRAVCRRDKSQEDHETRVGKYIMEKGVKGNRYRSRRNSFISQVFRK